MALLEFKVVSTKRTEIIPGNEVLNIDLSVSYAEFLSMTKNMERPYVANFELPDGTKFEHKVGFAKGGANNSNAKITMRNYPNELPEGTIVTLNG
ncbi:MAG: hypothetical protein ACYTDT_00260 [Planctomycetota bacterium]